MSNIFDDREKQFESQYKHDEELRFKVGVRRDKLLGQWVASKLGLKGADAEAYAKGLIATDIEQPGDDYLVERIKADFKARDIDISEHRIRKHLAECDAEAREQIMKGES
ncbi:MAG TPA: DUF1476 domain-containing protein [Alphaproteobacteria bacterium]|nr:DUF1476 domain-containing protein [Alphaproteobacteria bacterium]